MFPFLLSAQVGALSNAQLGANAALSDQWAVFYNPAALGEIRTFCVGVDFQQRFMSRKLATKSLAVASPVKIGAFSFGYRSFGYSLYQEHELVGGVGVKLSNSIYIGGNVRYEMIRFGEGYGDYNIFSSDVGIKAIVTKRIRLFSSVTNISNAQVYSINNEHKPIIFLLGINFLPQEDFVLSLAYREHSVYKNVGLLGVSYKVMKVVSLNFGVSVPLNQVAFGVSFKLKTINLVIASAYHQQLGFSPQSSIHYQHK